MEQTEEKIIKLFVPDDLGLKLLAAAEDFPLYDINEYYSLDLQMDVYRHIRNRCPEGFDWLINRIKESCRSRSYFALVENLKFDEGHRLFIAINRAFGDLVASPFKQPRQQLVHHIKPDTDLAATKGKKYETEKFHTDTADWEQPVKWISMVCVRSDQNGGGRSQILDMDTIRQEVIHKMGQEKLEMLETVALPFKIADYRGGGVAWRPVISDSMLSWRRYTINHALNDSGKQLSEEMTKTLDIFEDIIESTSGRIEFLMNDGDFLFMDNHKTIHSRTPIFETEKSLRFMIRSWVQEN